MSQRKSQTVVSRCVAVCVAWLFALWAPPAGADPIGSIGCVTTPCIDFGFVRQPNGEISYDGAGGPLIGSDLTIGFVAGFFTPQNAESFPVVGGQLNFTTGLFAGSSPGQGYVFEGGGSFRITGAVPAAGIEDSSTVLLDGTFTGATFGFGPPEFPTQFAVRPRGTDVKNDQLMAFFGLVPGTPMNFFGFILTDPPIDGLDGGGFSVTAFNTDIPNVPDSVPPIPEPASLLLAGTGIAAMALRRRLARQTGSQS
jgi:hypothetical protein